MNEAAAPAPAPPGELVKQPTSRHALVNAEGEEVVTPGCFTRGVMKCPCVIMWITFVLALLLAAAPILTGGVTVDSSASAGYDSPAYPNMVYWYAWQQVGGDVYEASSVEFGSGEGRRLEGRRLSESDEDAAEDLPLGELQAAP